VSVSEGLRASAVVTLGYADMHEVNAFSLKPLSLCAC
jgi:hypothetical protein